MTDQTAVLHDGERNRVWFQLGADDPAGDYQIAFRNLSTRTTTPWTTALTGTYPGTDDGRGIYVWARNGTAQGEDPTGTAVLTRGLYETRVRHTDGYLCDISALDVLEVE